MSASVNYINCIREGPTASLQMGVCLCVCVCVCVCVYMYVCVRECESFSLISSQILDT